MGFLRNSYTSHRNCQTTEHKPLTVFTRSSTFVLFLAVFLNLFYCFSRLSYVHNSKQQQQKTEEGIFRLLLYIYLSTAEKMHSGASIFSIYLYSTIIFRWYTTCPPLACFAKPAFEKL